MDKERCGQYQIVLVDCGLSRSHVCWWQNSNDTLGKMELSAYQFHGIHTKFSDEKTWSTGTVLLQVFIFLVSLGGYWTLYLLCYIWKVLGPGLADNFLLCPCYGPTLLGKIKMVAYLLLSGARYFFGLSLAEIHCVVNQGPASSSFNIWTQMESNVSGFNFYFVLLFNETVSHNASLDGLGITKQTRPAFTEIHPLLPPESWD